MFKVKIEWACRPAETDVDFSWYHLVDSFHANIFMDGKSAYLVDAHELLYAFLLLQDVKSRYLTFSIPIGEGNNLFIHQQKPRINAFTVFINYLESVIFTGSEDEIQRWASTHIKQFYAIFSETYKQFSPDLLPSLVENYYDERIQDALRLSASCTSLGWGTKTT